MPITTTTVSVGVAATQLATGATSLEDESSVAVTNNGSQTVFLGGALVTIGTGAPLVAGATMTIDLGVGDTLFGIVAATTANCNVFRTRQ